MSFSTLFRDVNGHVADTIAFEVPESERSTLFAAAPPPRGSRGETPNDEADRRPDPVGPWIACDEPTGVIEIHDPRLLRRGHEAFCLAVLEAAVARFGAYRAEVWLETSICRLEFGPGRFDRTEMARRAASAIETATPAVREGAGSREGARARGRFLAASATYDGTSSATELMSDEPSDTEGTHESPAQRRRLVHIAMAGGSFAMAVGAVILPGIPTLPFLIMTGRHAVLISPRIERMLKRHPWCAAILAEVETASDSTMNRESLWKMVGLAVLLVAGIWLFQPPLPVILLLEFALMAFLGWREWSSRSGPAEVRLGAVA